MVQTAADWAETLSMEVRIRRARCCGSGQCAETAPAVFMLDASGKSVVVDTEAASLDVLLEAAEACPCQAIEIDDEEGPCFP